MLLVFAEFIVLTISTIEISGNRHLTTVFNDQAEIQGLSLIPPPMGGIYLKIPSNFPLQKIHV